MQYATEDMYYGKDVTLAEFVLKYALGDMRDLPLSAFEPIERYSQEIAETEARIKEIHGWDEAEAEAAAEQGYKEELEGYESMGKERERVISAYKAMLEQVKDWTPPGEELEELKAGMIKALKDGIKFDSYELGEPPKKKSGAEYKSAQLKESTGLVESYTNLQKEYRAKAERKLNAAKVLRASFGIDL